MEWMIPVGRLFWNDVRTKGHAQSNACCKLSADELVQSNRIRTHDKPRTLFEKYVTSPTTHFRIRCATATKRYARYWTPKKGLLLLAPENPFGDLPRLPRLSFFIRSTEVDEAFWRCRRVWKAFLGGVLWLRRLNLAQRHILQTAWLKPLFVHKFYTSSKAEFPLENKKSHVCPQTVENVHKRRIFLLFFSRRNSLFWIREFTRELASLHPRRIRRGVDFCSVPTHDTKRRSKPIDWLIWSIDFSPK
jgi:hypothetical protein